MPDLESRYVGCMLGMAIGDALGGPTEFMSFESIRKTWPPGGVTDFCSFRGLPAGSYTDDTEMALAVARGILGASSLDVTAILDAIAGEFVRWYENVDWARSPGTTCTGSVAKLVEGEHWTASGRNDSMGCGTAMRAPPVGLAFAPDRDLLREVAARQSLITHGHDVATAGSVAVALMVAEAVQGAHPDDLLAIVRDSVAEISDVFLEALDRVPPAVELGNTAQAHSLLGPGWTADEAVAGALHALTMHPTSYRDAVLEAANSGGDTDTKACIVGAVLGASLGVGGIPDVWRQHVEDGELLVETGRELLLYVRRHFGI